MLATGYPRPVSASLLLKHGTLDGVLAAWGHPPEAEIARTVREVARLRGEVSAGLATLARDGVHTQGRRSGWSRAQRRWIPLSIRYAQLTLMSSRRLLSWLQSLSV